MEMEQVNESKISQLNSGGLINLRMHNLWVDRHKHALTGKYDKWNEILDAMWCELASDVKANSDEEKEYWRLNLEYAQACEKIPQKKGFEKMAEGAKGILIKKKVALIKKEVFLRRLQNKQGKGTAYLDEDDFE